MGDTLTHLPSFQAVRDLFVAVTATLVPGGLFILTWRDLTFELAGTDRFISIRSSENIIMTCFLEYTTPTGPRSRLHARSQRRKLGPRQKQLPEAPPFAGADCRRAYRRRPCARSSRQSRAPLAWCGSQASIGHLSAGDDDPTPQLRRFSVKFVSWENHECLSTGYEIALEEHQTRA
jgi:hypothetical protein